MIAMPFFFKTIFLTIAIIILRGTLPRYRSDHFLQDIWKEWLIIILSYLFYIFSAYWYFFLYV